MNIDELKKEVNNIKWFHRINLGNGIITPGRDKSQEKLQTLKMDENLAGKTVLDIGAWDGFFSFEAERRGASRVLATDSYIWKGDKHWGSKTGFELARKTLNSKVEDKEIEVSDISPETTGMFDLVLFLGVLYHLRHPLLALEKVASVTKNQLIIETQVDMINVRRPILAFYPSDELARDSTNWWSPNLSAMEYMLKDVGFKKVKMVYKTPLLYRAGGAILNPHRNKISFLNRINLARAVFHAWK